MSKELLDGIIKRRHDEGKTLSINRIDDEKLTSSQIRERARKYYGTWTRALESNGVTARRSDSLSKEDTIKELQRLQERGSRMRIVDFPPKLVRSIQRHYGGYTKAKKELGIEVNRKEGSGGHNKRRLSDVIKELKTIYPEINSKRDYMEKCSRIYYYSRKHLGSPYEIFNKAGLDVPKDSPRENIYWTECRIKEMLKTVVEEYETTAMSRLNELGYTGLTYAVKKRYGTWNAGLVAFGYEVAYEYRDPSDNLTKEETRERVLNALSNGVKPTREALENEIKGLKRSIEVNFGGIAELKKFCGFCAVSDKPAEKPMKIYRPVLVNAEGIKREITRMWYVGSPMNYAYVKDKRRHLLDAVNKHIGSWRQAVESIGLDYNDVSATTNVLSECGVDFEDLFAEILTELGYEYIREGERVREVVPGFNLKPDFILPNWRWMDCKLSEWTDIRETIIRYHGECPNGITIVYLRGRNQRIERGRKWKYEHVSVYQFTEQLPEDRREHFEKELRKIEERANENMVAK